MVNELPFDKELSLFAAPDDVESSNLFASPHSLPSSTANSVSTNKIRLAFPAIFDNGNGLQELYPTDPEILTRYLHTELDVSRLNRIHKHLWIAGQERPARALHHQVVIGRRMVVVEDPNLHLLWIGARLFVKPLPEFLLCYEVWERIRQERSLFEGAVGMLVSYIWLIRSKSDLRIAHSEGLVPAHLRWEHWTSLTGVALTRIDHKSLRSINPRYRYGELRLSRINWCWSFCSRTISISSLARGYFNAYHDYETWFKRHTAWITGTIVYVALVLTAMQVGLATPPLKDIRAFQVTSYVFTVFAMVAPLGILVGVLFAMALLVLWNWRYTLVLKRRQKQAQRRVWENEAIKDWAH